MTVFDDPVRGRAPPKVPIPPKGPGRAAVVVGGAKAAPAREAAKENERKFSAPTEKRRGAIGPPEVGGDGAEGADALGGSQGGPAGVEVQGEAAAWPARYRLAEADRVLTSHDPVTFEVAKGYPDGAQERRYHRDRWERQKVERMAAGLRPSLLVSTAATALEGPPVVDRSGVVWGGNGRAMALRRAYRDGTAERYRAELVAQAETFGFTTTDLDRFKAPILVRALDKPPADPGTASRALNESTTQGRDAATEAVSLGRRVSPATVALLEQIDPKSTIRASWATKEGRAVRDALAADGVFLARDAARHFRDGSLTRSGAEWAETALLGAVIPDADTLDRMNDTERDDLLRALPAAVAIEASGYSIGADLARGINEAADAGGASKKLDVWRKQAGLFGDGSTEASRRIADAIEVKGRLPTLLRAWAGLAASRPAKGDLFTTGAPDLSTLVSEAKTPAITEDAPEIAEVHAPVNNL